MNHSDAGSRHDRPRREDPEHPGRRRAGAVDSATGRWPVARAGETAPFRRQPGPSNHGFLGVYHGSYRTTISYYMIYTSVLYLVLLRNQVVPISYGLLGR